VSSLAQGSLPLWDPYAFSGAPFYLNVNIVGALDPTVLLAVPLIRFWDISILDIYNIHFLVRLFIFYLGSYALFCYISRNYWASLLGAIFTLYTSAPNAFWQHGSMIMITYVPLIILFLLQFVSPETPKKSKGLIFIALCYLIGISFNIYLPSYLLMYLSFILIYLFIARFIGLKSIRDIVISAGVWKLLIGILVFFIVAGPFIVSTFKILPSLSENFSLTRFDIPNNSSNSEITIHSYPLKLNESAPSRSTIYNLLSFLIPGTDTGFFVESRPPGYTENFLPFAVIPVMIVFLFFKRTNSHYKGLFLFVLIITGLYWLSPNLLYSHILRYFPGASTIRQMHNFLGYFILSFGALLAICLSEAIAVISNSKNRHKLSPIVVAIFTLAYIVALYVYWQHIRNMEIAGTLASPIYRLALQNNIISNGWQVIIICMLITLYFFASYNFRIYIAITIAGIIIYDLVDFNSKFKTYTIQPSISMSEDYIHHDREFKYNEIRVPFVPRHTVFWGYLPSLYRIPTAIPGYMNTYMSLTRRAYDFIRFTSAERSKIVSGVGSRRFGFFDKYIMAKNSRDALNLVAGMPKESLHDVIVLEEDPIQIVSKLKAVERVDRDSNSPALQTLSQIREAMLSGKGQYLADFYDKSEYINYKDYPRASDGFLYIALLSNHPARDWPWDKEHIGYFHILFGNIYISYYSFIHGYHTNPSIRTDFKEDKVCYTDIEEWQMKHIMPGFYEQIYNKYPYQCDLQKVERELIVSPELQGAFVTDDIGKPEKDNIIPGFTVVSLDPAKVSPSRSPYGRDEPTEVIAFGPNMISFKVQNSKPGLFYYADSYSSDWEATVSGSPAYIFKANFNYKAVFVPAGNHTITFSFNPKLYILLFKIFIVVSILLMPVPVVALLLYAKKR